MKIIVSIILFAASGICQSLQPRIPITASEMMIPVAHDSSREIAYSNKQAGVFYTETNGEHRSGWQGWRIMSTEIFENYIVDVGGHALKKSDAHAEAYPHQLVRIYPDSTRETVTLIDSIDALVIELMNFKRGAPGFRTYFSDSQNPDEYEISFEQNVLLIAKKRHLLRTQSENYPVWIGITIAGENANCTISNVPDTEGQSFSPASIHMHSVSTSIACIIVSSDTKSDAIAQAHRVATNYPSLIAKRKMRMEALLNRSYVRTDNRRFDKALYWAKISVDALIMNQRGKGIFAGLPWFDNYWGRDSFISLPGAALVTGNFEDAKDILKSFAAWQDTNPQSMNYGRIPNLVTTSSISYNNADGTPRFIMALEQYLQYSGDTAYVREIYPVVKRSIDGTIRYHTDSLGFLTHGDAETWMDAVGPEGPWSPRGNRANDIQMLWYRQLRSGSLIARYLLGNDNIDSKRWESLARRLKQNFSQYFVDTTQYRIYDHLRPDGTPDLQVRPNQLFALDLVDDPEIKRSIVRNVTQSLVYPYGVASLSQDDEDFHPYHHYAPYYVQDAAYHNGIVWTWLAGEWISQLSRSLHDSETGYGVTDNMVHQILDRGAVGTISELLDAVPRPGNNEPECSGTYSQAWSLAEFIRIFYDTYLNIVPSAVSREVDLSPLFLSSIFLKVEFNTWIKNYPIDVMYERHDTSFIISVTLPPEADTFLCHTGAVIHNRSLLDSLQLVPGKTTMLTFSGTTIRQERGNEQTVLRYVVAPENVKGTELPHLATPTIHPGLKSLKGVSHRLLTNTEIKQSNSNAGVLYDAEDPDGDDTGDGSYIYPKTVNLKPGSLDITHLKVSADEKNIYFDLRFKNLSNPGWHPEYGFQLTYVALAIDKGGDSGASRVGMNSNYTFSNGFVFNEIIYIGGGLRVVNNRNTILAEYLPAPGDEKNPLGDAASKRIRFCIPVELIGRPDQHWRFAVLVGAQDDHGGAGIGEYRSVESEAGEWAGGGKKQFSDPNIYDMILPR
jgi:glycogen debranching enzyme